MKHKTIKRIIIVTIIITIISTLTVKAYTTGKRDTVDHSKAGIYALTVKVVSIDTQGDTVTTMDSAGNLWAFSGAEDWQVNDCASLVMYDAGTQSIYDDEVISARYNAWILMQ